MLTKDIYGKDLSNYFNNAIGSYAQAVKPKIVINLLESKHLTLSNTNPIVNTDAHTVTSEGSLGSFFSEKQMINGIERETFTWGVTDALEKDGTVIKADGTWFAMPSSIEDEYEFGYWTKSKSQANGVFASSPSITFSFNECRVNKIKLITSEKLGQIKSARVRVVNANVGNVFDEVITFNNDEYFKEIYIKSDNAIAQSYKASSVILDIISTKNGLDCGRINELNLIYEVDITDYVIDYSVQRTRDVHESNVPIGGSQTSRATLKLNNSSKDWNILSNSSLYGQYMKKDLKIKVSTGWRIEKTDQTILTTELRSNISNTSSNALVLDTSIFPDSSITNGFTVIINPDKQNREVVLCSNATDNITLNFSQRGFANTTANSHATGSIVQFDPYEYVSMGEFYVDEWSSSSSDMTVSLQATDASRFMSDKTITKGFMLRNTTVGEAVKILTLMANFPNSDYFYYPRYQNNIIINKSIASYQFNEQNIDEDGNLISLSGGLRARFWGMREGFQSQYRDLIKNPSVARLSIDDTSINSNSYISSDFAELSANISTTYSAQTGGVFLNDYFFTGNDGTQYKQYFNGIIDGYYIPLETGAQDIIIDVQNAGVRAYLDDTLIIEDWEDNASGGITSLNSSTIVGGNLTLTAGTPYRIRIEFFHGLGVGNFNLRLFKKMAAGSKTPIPASDLRTTCARDSLGVRDAPYLKSNTNFNHHQNDGIYHANVDLAQYSDLNGSTKNSILLANSAYVRIPNHSSIQLSEKDFTYQAIVRFYNGSFAGDGEYLSSWANSTATSGFEFFHSGSTTHGFKIKTSSGTETVQTSNTALSTSVFHNIVVTYNATTKKMSYYLNGAEIANTTITGTIVTQASDITIGGRGSSFTSGTGAVNPTTTRELYIDEFNIYKKCLSASDVLNIHLSLNTKEKKIFPFLYGNEKTIRELIDEISFAELGRFYIDEENKGRYEHYNIFYENIDQFANVQYSLSDDTNIIDADMPIQLQANKIVVKVNGLATDATGLQPLWGAEDPTILATVNLEANMTASDTEVYVSTTTEPIFAESGYLVIDSEVIKYNGKTDISFLNLTRGVFGSTAAIHTANAKVREARFYEVVYEKSPAFNIKSPFITAIENESPAQISILKFESNAYSANLLIAASNATSVDSVIYAEGTNPLTEKVYFTRIAGVPIVISDNKEKVTEKKASLDENIRKYGLKEIVIDNQFITDSVFADEIASFLIQKVADPVPIINLNIMSVPKLQLGDKIRISSMDAFDIINGDYWIISQDFSYGSSLGHSLVIRKVS